MDAAQDRWTDRLSEYLDGDLAGAERTELERHLESCESCRGTLDGLRTVVERARSLPEPAVDSAVWPAIAARIRPERRRAWDWSGWRLSLTVPQLAAAGFALMLLSGGSVWMALRSVPGAAPRTGDSTVAARVRPSDSTARIATPPGAAPVMETPTLADAGGTPPARRIAPSRAPATQAVVVDFESARYDRAIADLETVLQQHRAELKPQTVEILARNLAVIDSAIEQSRRALAADPASPYLHGHLANNMKRKYELLRRAVSAVATGES